MEERIQGMTHGKINLMVLIVSMPVGGMENLILSIVSRLDKQKFNPVICCIKEPGELGEQAKKSGIKIISAGLMKSNRFSINTPFQLSGILKNHDIDVLWTNQYVANLYGRMAALLAGTPAVIAGFYALYDKPKIHRRFFNHFLSYTTDAMIAASEAIASDMKKYDHVNADKIKIIHNGIDLSFVTSKSRAECRRQMGLPEDAVIVGSLGRLSREKNHTLLVEAMKKLPAHIKGFIVGDGPLKNELTQAGRDRVVFTGRVESDIIPVALGAMDIFCFPSLWEGFPLALLEAMAAGLPVIASDIPTHREALGDLGLFIPSHDAGALAAAIKKLESDTTLRNELSGKMRERAADFSIDNTAAAYGELFEQSLREKNIL